ncbi:PREDICTED: plant UBX domain-containing protein 10-like [Ipomoea nil]|uniref:plant UBX domain-containing protein 10-like n=1 Tax=Ipomoea nil TaxID=35883 RepID=UPI0009016D2A|nr:PREDICTED: plant UBX domain-containing protein 10-like [Ipomoea nil]XP_019182033.1 PREDICTED: plant UBX domain-containing protein 10-like [Ipomoea nil]
MSSSSSSSSSFGCRRSTIVRRMVNLPRNILGGFSRMMDQGMELMRTGGRRHHQHYPLPHPLPPHPPLDFHYYEHDPTAHDEWAFLNSFERQYGTQHPFFYACRFMDALKICRDEHKLLFLYLHSPDHPFSPSFCRETLCSEVVVQFLDANYVCWAALADRAEGLQMATTLRASTYPFCCVVASAPGDSIAVLQQMEGPVSAAELVEILQRTIEEQGVAFGSAVAKDQEKLWADRRLREEQDVAYITSLQIDQEKEKLSRESEQNVPKQQTPTSSGRPKHISSSQTHQRNKVLKEGIGFGKGNSQRNGANGAKSAEIIQIQIRFPNGERKEQSFLSTDKIQAIYRYIDSLGMPGVENYRLISNFPRKVYGVDQMAMTVKDAGLHPKASLFLELI